MIAVCVQGASFAYEVVLERMLDADVNVSITTPSVLVVVSPCMLLFPANAGTVAQTVIVSTVDD